MELPVSKRRGIKNPTGPWLLALTVLRSPLTLTTLGTCLAVAAVVGLGDTSGGHPGEGVFVRLPLALLPFVLLARMDSNGLNQAATVSLSLGIFCFLIGSWPGDGRSGRLEVGTGTVEGFEQTIAGRSVPTHLGGQLTGRKADNQLVLEVGVAGVVKSSAEVSLSPRREVTLGAYRVRSEGLRASSVADTAVVTLTPREGEGAPITVRAPLGRTVAVGKATRITTKNVRGDYLGVVGSAAQLDMTWADGQEIAWHFVDAPDLDQRVGTSPWTVRLDRLDVSPVHKLGIRKAGVDLLAWAGLALIGLGLVVSLIGRVRYS